MTHLDNSFVYDLPNGNSKCNHGEYFSCFMDISEHKIPESTAIYLNRNKRTVQMQTYDPTGQSASPLIFLLTKDVPFVRQMRTKEQKMHWRQGCSIMGWK